MFKLLSYTHTNKENTQEKQYKIKKSLKSKNSNNQSREIYQKHETMKQQGVEKGKGPSNFVTHDYAPLSGQHQKQQCSHVSHIKNVNTKVNIKNL